MTQNGKKKKKGKLHWIKDIDCKVEKKSYNRFGWLCAVHCPFKSVVQNIKIFCIDHPGNYLFGKLAGKNVVIKYFCWDTEHLNKIEYSSKILVHIMTKVLRILVGFFFYYYIAMNHSLKFNFKEFRKMFYDFTIDVSKLF